MTSFASRVAIASRAALVHLLLSAVVASGAAALVFGVWYPFPYRELAGGRELFWIVVAVDVVMGPFLTLILFNPLKPRRELVTDLLLVALLQLAALGYGLWTVWQARPLFLVMEVDRYKVVAAPNLDDAALTRLSGDVKAPGLLSGPMTVSLRKPLNEAERQKVLFESMEGGPDYAERPEFYLPYQGEAAEAAWSRGRQMEDFIKRYPDQRDSLESSLKGQDLRIADVRYLPVLGRQDWVAVIDRQGGIRTFLPGDGF